MFKISEAFRDSITGGSSSIDNHSLKKKMKTPTRRIFIEKKLIVFFKKSKWSYISLLFCAFPYLHAHVIHAHSYFLCCNKWLRFIHKHIAYPKTIRKINFEKSTNLILELCVSTNLMFPMVFKPHVSTETPLDTNREKYIARTIIVVQAVLILFRYAWEMIQML